MITIRQKKPRKNPGVHDMADFTIDPKKTAVSFNEGFKTDRCREGIHEKNRFHIFFSFASTVER